MRARASVPRVTSPADAATLIEWSASSDRQTLARALTEAYSIDLREEIGRITSPVRVLATWRGWHDQLAATKIVVPKASFVETFAAQYATLPRLTFALHDTARHFIMWDVLRRNRRVPRRSRFRGAQSPFDAR